MYELMTLRPTFDSPDRLRLIEQIRDQEPPRPRSLDSRIPGDLETVVLKSIEKDPRRRYATADEMGEDLRRFLDGEPIKARQVGELERAWKWTRRRPGIACLIALAVASMLVGTVVSASYSLRADEKAEAARLAEIKSRASELEADRARRRAIVERDNSRRLSVGLAVDRRIALAEEGQPERGLHWMLQGLKTAPDEDDDFRLMIRRNLRGWLAQIHEPLNILNRVGGQGGPIASVFSPDGRTFVTWGQSLPSDTTPLTLWDTATGRSLATYPEADPPVAFRPDDWTLLARRARVRSSADAFEEAAADYERARRVGPREAVLDWQAQCAAGASEAGRWAEALWYLDRLVAARPDDWTLRDDRSILHHRLGHAAEEAADHARALELGGDAALVLPAAEQLAQAGDWGKAARLLARCGRRNPLDAELARAWSVACLAAGDRDGYLQARAAVIARVAELPRIVSLVQNLASVLPLAPGNPDDSAPIAVWLELKRPSMASKNDFYLHDVSNVLGGLSLRAGRLDEAIARLTEGIAADHYDLPSDWAFLSQSHARKGDTNAARRYLDRLRSWDPVKDRATFWEIQEDALLRREAEALLFDRSFPVDPFVR
jgi:tetratricopeptide (TPR) repeat protein